MIYTSYFANLKNLPPTITPIAISAGPPAFYTGLWYSKLGPKASFFFKWKENHDNDYYISEYRRLVLDCLDQKKVVDELLAMSPTLDIALVCYEAPNKFCHRHLVAEWLKTAGYKCEEFRKD